MKSTLPLVCAIILASCSADKFKDSLPGVYKLDVNQGNVVTQEMVNQLKPKMNKRQVTYIMGSPMLVDAFHQNRWDYLYSAQASGKDRELKRISLHFENDELVGIDGDFRPNAEPVAESAKETTVIVPKIKQEQTLWSTLKRWFGAGDG